MLEGVFCNLQRKDRQYVHRLANARHRINNRDRHGVSIWKRFDGTEVAVTSIAGPGTPDDERELSVGTVERFVRFASAEDLIDHGVI